MTFSFPAKPNPVRERVERAIRELRKDPISWFFIVVITAFFVYFLVVPVVVVLINAFTVDGHFSLETAKIALSRKSYFNPSGYEGHYAMQVESNVNYKGSTVTVVTIKLKDRGIILNTIQVGILTTLLSLVLGTSTAFIMARYNFPGKFLFQGLMLISLIARIGRSYCYSIIALFHLDLFECVFSVTQYRSVFGRASRESWGKWFHFVPDGNISVGNAWNCFRKHSCPYFGNGGLGDAHCVALCNGRSRSN